MSCWISGVHTFPKFTVRGSGFTAFNLEEQGMKEGEREEREERERERGNELQSKSHHNNLTMQGQTRLVIEYPCFSAFSVGMSSLIEDPSNVKLMYATDFGPSRF